MSKAVWWEVTENMKATEKLQRPRLAVVVFLNLPEEVHRCLDISKENSKSSSLIQGNITGMFILYVNLNYTLLR